MNQQWHVLKITPKSFNEVVSRVKTCEVRLNDRDYQVGDILVLREFVEEVPEEGEDPIGLYTGCYAIVSVENILLVSDVFEMSLSSDAIGKFPDYVADMPDVACMSVIPVPLTAVISTEEGIDPATGERTPEA